MVTEIVVPAPCGWINSNQRLHRMAEAKLTAAWRETAGMAWLAQNGPSNAVIPGDGCIRIIGHIWKPRRGRYDPGNLYPTFKACVDGFVSAGALPDDDWKHVIGPDMRHGGIGEPCIIFTFLPIKSPEITVPTQ